MSKGKRKQAERLTGLQERFGQEYVIDFNGTAAARRAGYKGDDRTLASIAHTLLKMPKIRAYWRSLMRDRAMAAEEAVARMSDWARGSIRPFIRLVDEDGNDHTESVTAASPPEVSPDRPRLRFTVDLTTAEARAHYHLVKKISWTASGLPILELHDAKDATARLLALHGDIPIGELTNQDPDADEPPEQEMSVEEQEARAIEIGRILQQFDVGAAARAYDTEE